ncbi:MAG: hypothetical protein HY763_15230 [Planctomycetes bacterium]|nr:hypothetical protein [Planctomycetota bacterium]
MAIRFLCSACAQPIEVDDEWSLKPVICPYCRKTVTAPRESTLDVARGIPSASPISAPAGSFAPAPAPARGNALAVAALGFACFSLVLYATAATIMKSNFHEIEPTIKTAMEAVEAGDMNRLVEIREAFLTQPGGPPAWFVAFSVTFFGTGLAWVATLVCGLMGLRRAYRRKFAVASLLVAGLVPVLVCCGVGMGP